MINFSAELLLDFCGFAWAHGLLKGNSSGVAESLKLIKAYEESGEYSDSTHCENLFCFIGFLDGQEVFNKSNITVREARHLIAAFGASMFNPFKRLKGSATG